MKKYLFVFFIFFSIVISNNVFADDEDTEVMENLDVWEQIKAVSANNSDTPKINSRAAVVIDRNSKAILYGKNENDKRPMASTTKIMTAIVCLEKGNLDQTIEVCGKAAGIGGSRLGLKKGDKVTLNDLLYGLLMRSGNDAAIQIAVSIAGSVENFANLMNEKAKELSLNNTHFVTPHGLDNDNHYTTPYELAVLTDYALENKKFAEIVNTKNYTININGKPKNLNNTNELLGSLNGVNGVKTGFTNKAGRCLVTSTTRNNWQIICVVLGADTKKIRTKDSINLIEYSFKNYELINIKDIILSEYEKWKEKNEAKIYVNKGIKEKLHTTLSDINYDIYPIKKNEKKDIRCEINVTNYVESPVHTGDIIGSIELKIADKNVCKVDIKCQEDIERKNIMDYFYEVLINMGSYVVDFN